jgi:hypothetical protein
MGGLLSVEVEVMGGDAEALAALTATGFAHDIVNAVQALATSVTTMVMFRFTGLTSP